VNRGVISYEFKVCIICFRSTVRNVFINVEKYIVVIRDAPIPGARPQWQPNLARWRLIFMGFKNGSCFMLPFGSLEFWRGTYIFEKLWICRTRKCVCSKLMISARNFMFYAWNRLDLNHSYILMCVYPYSAVTSVEFKFRVELFCDAGRNTRPEVKRYWLVEVAAKTVNAVVSHWLTGGRFYLQDKCVVISWRC
jgi:hypothetical protein